MGTLLWLSFFFASPPSNGCSTHGAPMLEIRERSEATSDMTTKRVYASGAWVIAGAEGTDQGCFSRGELRSIRQALRQAAWRITTSPIACFAYDPNFTEYVVNGRVRYTARLCSGSRADARTQRAIDLVASALPEVAPLPVPPPPPAPPPTPPKPPALACRATGTPLFEIRKRSDEAEPTSTTTIYSSGAWIFEPIDAAGDAGAPSRGCLDRQSLATIRNAVGGAPWDVTTSRIVCKAYGPSFTEYYVNGKFEYMARMCGAQRIDATSAAAIKTIEAELATALPSL